MAVTLPENPLKRRGISTGQQGVVQMDTRGVTDGITSFSSELKDQMETRNRDEYAKAKSRFALVKTEQDNAYTDDEDFGTINERYTAQLDQGLSVAAEGITDARLREQFLDEMGVHVAEGRARNYTLAQDKAKDYERGQITQEGEILMRQAEASDTDTGFLFKAYSDRLRAAAERNVLSHEQAESSINTFRTQVAGNKLKAMNAEDRIRVLTKDTPAWLEHIPKNVIETIRDEARDELRAGKAIAASFEMLDKGYDLEQGERELYKKYGGKENGQLFSEAVREFNNRWVVRESSRATAQRNAYTDLWEAMTPAQGDAVALTTIRTDPEYRKKWEQLSKEQRDNLHTAEQNKLAGKERKHSDRTTIMLANRLRQQMKNGVKGAGIKLYDLVTKSVNDFNAADFNTWSQIAATGIEGEAVKPLFDAFDEIELLTEKWSSEDKYDLFSFMNQQYYDYTRVNSQNPTPEQVQTWREQAFVKVKDGWFSNKHFYSMTDEDLVQEMLKAPSAEDAERYLSGNFTGQRRASVMMKYMQTSNPFAYSQAVDAAEAEKPGAWDYFDLHKHYRKQLTRVYTPVPESVKAKGSLEDVDVGDF